MFKIREVIIDPPLVLAPVAGHTDSLFRQAIKSLGGCGLVVSELVSTEGMTRHQDRTSFLTHFEESERPIAIQIFGSNAKRMADAAAMVEGMGADIVDVNFGCPSEKVVRQGGGSNLLRDLPPMENILRTVRKAIRILLTVKIRSGWDHNSINALQVLKLAEDCGGKHSPSMAGLVRICFPAMRTGGSSRVKERARIPIIAMEMFLPHRMPRACFEKPGSTES